MNIQSINSDIQKLEKALRLIEQTENYQHFQKSKLILETCEQINALKEKRDRQAHVCGAFRAVEDELLKPNGIKIGN